MQDTPVPTRPPQWVVSKNRGRGAFTYAFPICHALVICFHELQIFMEPDFGRAALQQKLLSSNLFFEVYGIGGDGREAVQQTCERASFGTHV